MFRKWKGFAAPSVTVACSSGQLLCSQYQATRFCWTTKVCHAPPCNTGPTDVNKSHSVKAGRGKTLRHC